MAAHPTTHDLQTLPTEILCEIAQHMDNKTLFNFRLAGSLASQSSWDTWCKRFATDLSVLLCAQGIEELEQGVASHGMLRHVRRLTFLGVKVVFRLPREPGLWRDRVLRARHRAQTEQRKFSHNRGRWITRLADILETVNPMATVGILSFGHGKISIERSFGYRGFEALFKHRNASNDWRMAYTGDGIAEVIFRANALLSRPLKHFLLGGALSGMGSSASLDPEPSLILRQACSTLTFLALDLRDWADMFDRREIQSWTFICRILECSVNLHSFFLSNFVLNTKQYMSERGDYLRSLLGPFRRQHRSSLRHLHLMCWGNIEVDDLLRVIWVFADGLITLALEDIALPDLKSWRELFSELHDMVVYLEKLHLTGVKWPTVDGQLGDKNFITLPWMPLWDPTKVEMTICADTRVRVQKGLMQLSRYSMSHKNSPADPEWGTSDVRGDGVFIYE